jgi:hypothetical protein
VNHFITRPACIVMLLALTIAPDLSADPSPRKAAVLDAVMIHGSVEMPIRAEEESRLDRFADELRAALEADPHHELVDHTHLEEITARHAEGQRLDRCIRCQVAIGRELGADRVFQPGIFKMSELILLMHVEVRGTATGELHERHVRRIAGNTDESWRRGLAGLTAGLGLQEAGAGN